jgi:hypothetical protein
MQSPTVDGIVTLLMSGIAAGQAETGGAGRTALGQETADLPVGLSLNIVKMDGVF